MLQRKIYDKLLEWHRSKDRKALVMQGARQVGKTYIVEKFGRENYEETVEINFKEMPSAKEIFLGMADTVKKTLQLYPMEVKKQSADPFE